MENPENTGLCKESIFSDFFKKHAKSLRNHLLYKFGNQEQAEDLTQEAFIKLWQNCIDVPIEKAKSYIYTIAINSSLNSIVHEKVKLNYKNSYSHSDRSNESPEFILEEKQFKDKLLTAIDNLNEIQRVTFLTHRIDGKKYAEIAEELGISIKAVEKRIHLALVELRKEFEYFK